MENVMKKTVMAVAGMPGLADFRCLVFTIDGNAGTGDELLDLARKAASMYAKTDAGKEAYERNCDNFNWADLVDAVGTAEFSRICTQLGGLSISYVVAYDTDDLVVDIGEGLMDEDSFDIDNDTVLCYRIISDQFSEIEELFDNKGIDYDYDCGDRMMVNQDGLDALAESDIDFDQVV